jgi:predicted DNA binding CopG/RHH family protein
MSNLKLTPEELELLASYENQEWQSVKNINEQEETYQAYARATFRKDKRINIRISEKDLLALQKRAIREGIPYQTLVSSVLHKYVTGALVEEYTNLNRTSFLY